MAMTIAALRSYGTRRVTVHCSAGSFEGSFVSQLLSEQSVMLLFALHDDPQMPIVIDIHDIAEITER